MTQVHRDEHTRAHEEHHHDHDHPHDHTHFHDNHHHDYDHEHHPDHSHDHEHKHQHSWWETMAGALHLPGYGHSHAHEDIARQLRPEDNTLAIRTVWLALLVLGLTTLLQIAIVVASGSVALLADTVHNLGDALNSVPLLIAFYLARRAANRRYTYGYHRAEDIAGIFIVVSIGFSAAYILWESFQKLLNPQPITNLPWVALAALVGFAGNEIVALLQIRVGRKIGSDAMIADGLHARTDGFTSLAVLIAVVGTVLGMPILDPIVGLFIGMVIVFITRDAALTMWYHLMDAVDPQLVETAEHIIKDHPEIRDIRQIQMRQPGRRLYVEMLLALEGALTVAESEPIIDHIRHHLYHSLPNLAQVTIGAVPYNAPHGAESAHHHD